MWAKLHVLSLFVGDRASRVIPGIWINKVLREKQHSLKPFLIYNNDLFYRYFTFLTLLKTYIDQFNAIAHGLSSKSPNDVCEKSPNLRGERKKIVLENGLRFFFIFRSLFVFVSSLA